MIALKKMVMSSKVSSNEVYLDSSVANNIVADIEKQFKTIALCTQKSSTLLKKAVACKQVKGSYASTMKRLSKVLNNRTKGVVNRSKGLKNKYDKDSQEYVIKILNERLTELESRIATLEGTEV